MRPEVSRDAFLFSSVDIGIIFPMAGRSFPHRQTIKRKTDIFGAKTECACLAVHVVTARKAWNFRCLSVSREFPCDMLRIR
jgi:hypothetical protein